MSLWSHVTQLLFLNNAKKMHLLGPRLERKFVAMFRAQLLTGKDKGPTGGLWYFDFFCLHHPQGTVRDLLLCPFHRWHCGSGS